MKFFSKKQSDIPRRRLATNNASDNKISVSADIFKRNRTMSGTSANSLDNSPRVHAHHLAIKRRRVFGVFLIALLAVICLWMLVSNFTASVVITTSDATVIKPLENSKYTTSIQDYLDINPLSRFRFLLDQSALSSYVSSKLPEVESVSLKNMVGLGSTDFSVKMRQPVAGWKINDQQYFVDAKGVPFGQNYFADPIVQIVDNSGATLQTGTASVSKRFLGFVGLVVSSAKSSDYTVTQAILPADTTRELEIKLKETNTMVKLSIDRSAGEQVEDMSRALQYFTSHSQSPSYIDVRVSGKAFYM
jgi:cell division septal protein FtsQ